MALTKLNNLDLKLPASKLWEHHILLFEPYHSFFVDSTHLTDKL